MGRRTTTGADKKRKSSSKAEAADEETPGSTASTTINSTTHDKKTQPGGGELDTYPTDEKLYLKEMIRLHVAGVHKPTKVETTTMTAKDEATGEAVEDAVGVVSKKAKLMAKLEDDGLVYVTETKIVKSYNLTETGVKTLLGSSDGDGTIKKGEFANNNSLRSHIITNAYHSDTTDRIWTVLEECGRQGLSKTDLVNSLQIAGGSSNPNFFYSLEGLKNREIVEEVKPAGSKTKFVRLVKTNAFIEPPPQFEKTKKVVVHVSPPCQGFSGAVRNGGNNAENDTATEEGEFHASM
mmetsp:Transcript_27387/g.65752  ORF Transcript_27387/g.65752 Transcript_27387/m.65752 type:complete len:294 (-) Transcript_27387:16-897(-)|eukprot:CAMPEP_0113448614 /NCGR_PEP_ID=MMETSP0014_2-20120614/4857_1 /TAXON_ID=2857 /ORGANISM="Nitzschia sp." /LENGTH=293 /DNA_ID=CAMNT_0000339831 /DNA_START=886 /DNA_END=1767 /DNA_ORIENTATION=+ /assembly_acc=CAM_ASM_000159